MAQHEASAPPASPRPPAPSSPGGMPLHMDPEWRPPRSERSLDAALWWGQTAERVSRRNEAQLHEIAPELRRLSDVLDRLIKAGKWGGAIFFGAMLVSWAHSFYTWVTTLHH